MATKQDNCTDWQVKVRCYDPSTGWKLSSCTIPEINNCVQMPGYEGMPMGRPIDANLTANYIRNFYVEIANAHGNYTDEELKQLSAEELLAGYLQARKFLTELTNISYGMTIDKDFILKILSQPGCEGIRAYICYKDEEPDAPISLITMGVDSQGWDLNYNKKGTVKYSDVEQDQGVLPPMAGAPAVQHVEMRSLGGEFVTPPYTFVMKDFAEPTNADEQQKDFLSRFVLLNVATGKKELIEMAESGK